MEERNINPRRQPGRREAGRREAPPQRSSSYQGSPPRYRDCRDEPARWRNDDWGDWDDWDDGEPVRRSGGSWAVSVLMAFYKVLVVLSIIVVAVYIGSKVFIRPPDQSQLPPPAQIGDASGDDAAGTAPPSASGLERRKGVYTIFLTATDKGGSLTDTMMLMTYDTKEQTVGVVSIPRDTLVARSKGNPHLVYGSGGGRDLAALRAADAAIIPSLINALASGEASTPYTPTPSSRWFFSRAATTPTLARSFRQNT